jgi:hypothetical protein
MQWAEHLLADGWEVAFAPRINGTERGYDILACKGGEIVLWQVKSTVAGPFASHGPVKREAHREAASRAGGVASLCWWPFDRKPPRTYPVDTWPKGR